MKKFINKINSKATELAIRTKTALASKSGEGYIDTAVKIIIGVVVGGVILVGLYALFKATADEYIKVQDDYLKANPVSEYNPGSDTEAENNE